MRLYISDDFNVFFFSKNLKISNKVDPLLHVLVSLINNNFGSNH